jgi:hypothetical protein
VLVCSLDRREGPLGLPSVVSLGVGPGKAFLNRALAFGVACERAPVSALCASKTASRGLPTLLTW